MVYVYYYRYSEKKMEAEVFSSLIQQLPTSLKLQVSKYRRWQDRQRSLIGKILLTKGLYSFGHAFSIKNLRYTKFQRPYLNSSIDFNISHAGDYTLCTISTTSKVGIDIEKSQCIDINDFESQFSALELSRLKKAENSCHEFFKLWTKKEALLKATGTGLNVPLNKINIENNKVVLDGQEWFLHEIMLHREYPCHLCTSASSPTITIREIQSFCKSI